MFLSEYFCGVLIVNFFIGYCVL